MDFPAAAVPSVVVAREEVGKMKPKQFLNALDEARLLEAIRAAEARTSGEIRLVIAHRSAPDPLFAAQKHFDRLRMANTRERNAVLLFIAPKSHTFAIIGDSAIHAKCGQPFWDDVAAILGTHFKKNEFTEGLLAAITRAGALLAEHFPPREDDRNELSDEIVQG